MTRIIVNDFDCRNNYATFGTKLGVWYFHMGGFSEIVQTKFQQCPLFICFITVDALVVGYQVTVPSGTVSSAHPRWARKL